MPPSASRQPAAERGEFEGLREVAQRQALRPQRIFECGAVDARLNSCGTRDSIDLDDLIQLGEVDRDDTGIRVADVAFHAAHNARAAAEGNGRDILASTPIE